MDPVLVEIPAHIQGSRVLLRRLEDADAPALFAAIEESRAHLLPWMPWAREHRSVADTLAYIRRSQAHWILRQRLPVGIFSADGTTILGGSGLEHINWDVRSFEIGYWLCARAEGHGYVRETVLLLTNLAFGQLAAKRVEIRMDVRNERSERVAQRLGFLREGTLHSVILDVDGAPADDHIYALTPETYRQRESSTGP